ncbi:hypothetical protein NMY22_g16570 [Coprinellus aureogranulatus]|nr:hypothetical protein NMY22_g16570 [Coprinellus aureogranulatus]
MGPEYASFGEMWLRHRKSPASQRKTSAHVAFQQEAEPSVKWCLTVPEVESFSTLFSESSSGRSFSKACRQLWTKSEHVPDTLHYLAIFRERPDQPVIKVRERMTRNKLEDLTRANVGAAIQVIWLEEIEKKGLESPSHETDSIIATIRFMAENLGVSPLFLDCLFIPRSAMPFNKLSEWPYPGDDRHYSTLESDLSGMYRTVNENCVCFRHSFRQGQHVSSTYVVHTMRHQTSSSASKFFSRVEHLRARRETRTSLLNFMAIDVLFNDMATAHLDLNECYRSLKTALDSIDEHIRSDSEGIQERVKAYYSTLKDAYKVLNVLNTRCDDQFQTIGALRDLVKAWSILDCAEALVVERERRCISLFGTLDGMKMEMNVLTGDIKARSQFFGTLMSLHLGALMQIDSSTSLSIASSSKRIAEETKKDGRSMKIIAVVTMVFLPASLVAGIIDTPFFTTGEEALSTLKVSPQFWILWVVSVSLTILVLLAWLFMPRMSRAFRIFSGSRLKSEAEKWAIRHFQPNEDKRNETFAMPIRIRVQFGKARYSTSEWHVPSSACPLDVPETDDIYSIRAIRSIRDNIL